MVGWLVVDGSLYDNNSIERGMDGEPIYYIGCEREGIYSLSKMDNRFDSI